MGGWGCAFDPWNGLVRLWQDATLQVSLGLVGVVARHSGTFSSNFIGKFVVFTYSVLLTLLFHLPVSLLPSFFFFSSSHFFSLALYSCSVFISSLFLHSLTIVLPSFPFTSPLPLDSQCSHSPRVYMNASSCLILPLFPFPLLSSPTLSSRSGVYRWWLG